MDLNAIFHALIALETDYVKMMVDVIIKIQNALMIHIQEKNAIRNVQKKLKIA